MLDYILSYFNLEQKERIEIKEEVKKIGLNHFQDIFLLVCSYKNENFYDRYNILENYLNKKTKKIS